MVQRRASCLYIALSIVLDCVVVGNARSLLVAFVLNGLLQHFISSLPQFTFNFSSLFLSNSSASTLMMQPKMQRSFECAHRANPLHTAQYRQHAHRSTHLNAISRTDTVTDGKGCHRVTLLFMLKLYAQLNIDVFFVVSYHSKGTAPEIRLAKPQKGLQDLAVLFSLVTLPAVACTVHG